MVSHTSVVKAPRTARAFSRAARRHDTMDEGLYPSRTMKSSTLAGVISPYLAMKAGISSLIESNPSQPSRAASAAWGSSEVS